VKKLLFSSLMAAAVVTAAPSVSAQEADASVVVVHGIPDTPVDVYVNDDLTLDDFAFGTVTDALALPAGNYAIAIRAGDAEATAEPILSADATLSSGDDVSLVAHLDESGTPKLTPFVNDTSPTAAGNGRLVVRHTAAAPAVDVLAAGKPVFTGVTNPNEGKADLPASTVSASVALAGTTDPVIGPADVPVTEGAATIVYAVGSAADGNLQVLVQSIDGLHSAPGAVDTGNSGLAADDTDDRLLTGVVVSAGLAAVLVTGLVIARRRLVEA
jgi:hypothetical protein